MRQWGNGAMGLIAIALVVGDGIAPRAATVDILHPVSALPALITATFQEPRAYVETSTGESLVLDAGAHTVFLIDAKRTGAKKLLTIGGEWGHILKPSAFALGSSDIFAIA